VDWANASLAVDGSFREVLKELTTVKHLRRNLMYRALLILFALGLVACQNPTNSAVNLPVKTNAFGVKGNAWINYYTNDAASLNYGRYLTYDSTAYSSPATITVVLKKNSGNSTTGYGFLWNYQDSSNFLRLLISEDGWWQVCKKVSGSYSELFTWASNTALRQGYGVENTISLVPQNGVWRIYFNGQDTACVVADSSLPNSGRIGLYVVVGDGSIESFPNTPVDVDFKITLPTPVPSGTSASVGGRSVAKSGLARGTWELEGSFRR
jgi:hypothetical protein